MTKMVAALIVIAMMMAGCGGGDTQTAGSPAPSPSNEDADASATSNRDRNASTVVGFAAVDFAFEGVPETLEAGKTTFVLTNEGENSHEMTIGLMPEGWTIEEVALGSSESGTEIVGVIEPVEPGASGEVTIDLEPGQYGYICHEIEGTDGQAHYFHGMLGEFKVVK